MKLLGEVIDGDFNVQNDQAQFLKLTFVQTAPAELPSASLIDKVKYNWSLSLTKQPGSKEALHLLQEWLCDPIESELVQEVLIEELDALQVLSQKLIVEIPKLVPRAPSTDVGKQCQASKVSLFRLSLESVKKHDGEQENASETRRVRSLADNADELVGLLVLLLIYRKGYSIRIDERYKAVYEQLLTYSTLKASGQNLNDLDDLERFGPQVPSSRRLLKLIVPVRDFIDHGTERCTTLGMGRHGTVYAYHNDSRHVLKRIPLDLRMTDNIAVKLEKVFAEITCLELLGEAQMGKGEIFVTPIVHYGVLVDPQAHIHDIFIKMPRGRETLVEWRKKRTETSKDLFVACLDMILKLARAIVFIEQHGVVHYDIRCSNVLLLPKGGEEEAEEEGKAELVVLGDFGESYAYDRNDLEMQYQHQGRGTELVQAPEMLTVSTSSQARNRANHDRRRKYTFGTNSAADVWSFGCMMFELLTESFLYEEAQTSYSTFFMRLTQKKSDEEGSVLLSIIPEEKKAYLKEIFGVDLANVIMERMLVPILVTDPRKRPTPRHIVERLEQLLKEM